jgi:hypothetical protein
MFTDHICPVCTKELETRGLQSWAVTPETGQTDVRLTTEPVAVAKCTNGHESLLIIRDGAYAMLFERGLQRLVIGNTRDAVIDAYTAFEMYLSHVPARARYDREKGASPANLRKDTESATKYAERALAAALATASLVSALPPPKVDQKKTTEFRNRAVHAGYYPNEAEAETMCIQVEKLIYEFERCLGTQKCVNAQSYWSAAIDEDIRTTIKRQAVGRLPSVQINFDTVLAGNHPPNKRGVRVAQRLAEYRADIAEGDVAWRVW